MQSVAEPGKNPLFVSVSQLWSRPSPNTIGVHTVHISQYRAHPICFCLLSCKQTPCLLSNFRLNNKFKGQSPHNKSLFEDRTHIFSDQKITVNDIKKTCLVRFKTNRQLYKVVFPGVIFFICIKDSAIKKQDKIIWLHVATVRNKRDVILLKLF